MSTLHLFSAPETELSDGAKMVLLVTWRAFTAICALPIIFSLAFLFLHVFMLAPTLILIGEFGTLNGLYVSILAFIPAIVAIKGDEFIDALCYPKVDGLYWTMGWAAAQVFAIFLYMSIR